MEVSDFERVVHKITKLNDKQDNYALILCFDHDDVELAEEFGKPGKEKERLLETAKKYIEKRYPYCDVSVLKIMAGGVIVATFFLANKPVFSKEESKMGIPTEIHEPIYIYPNKKEED